MMRRDLRRVVIRNWPSVVLACRGTLAALAALAVAVALRLECPYWAAMTALIVIQPTRGLLLEKSFYRLVGTALGSLAGLLMVQSAGSPASLTILLSLWMAGCVGAGNLMYGLRSYGAMVAACTGAVIAMAGYNNPPHLNDLVFGRIACITIGILVSTTLTLFFTRRRSKRELLDRLVKVAAADIEWLALLLRGGRQQELVALQQDILVEIAEIEGAMDAVWAGSLDLKKRKRRVRSLIVSLLTLLEAGKLTGYHLARRGFPGESWREPLARQLEEVAWRLGRQGSLDPSAGLEVVLAETRARFPLLGDSLSELAGSLGQLIDQWDGSALSQERPATHLFIRHRDWREAGRAALRASGAIAAVGALWILSGWQEGPLMMIAASIMVSIFSTHDRPAAMLGYVFCGASVGVAAALFCRLVLLPGVGDPVLQGAACVPVLMAGIMALSRRRTALGAMDAVLFFLFVMQPGVPVVPDAPSYIAGGCAALGGVGVALLSFRFLLPIDPARRLRSLLVAISRDLATFAAADSASMEKCRARTQHRVLRLLAQGGKLDHDLGAIIDGGLAALIIGRWMQWLREMKLKEGISPEALEALRETTIKLSAAVKHPEGILFALEAVSVSLGEAMEPYLGCFQLQTAVPIVRGTQPVSALRLLLSMEGNDQLLSSTKKGTSHC
jgi:uncharacterized membrane protein YccC